MSDSKDRAGAYLNLLAAGYQLEDYTFTTTGAVGTIVVASYNPSRVYFYSASFVSSVGGYRIRIDGRLLFMPVKIANVCVELSISQHFILPQQEIVYVDGSGLPDTISAYGIVKI